MANTAIPFHQTAATTLTPNWAKRLTLTEAPAVMEFGVEVGAGTQPVVFKGDVTAQQLKEILESCADLEGYRIDVVGVTHQSGTGPDGVALHSGEFIVMLAGMLPYPEWGTVLNSELQSFIVEDGGASYTLNGGSTFNLGTSKADLQTNQRSLGSNYADVIVEGLSYGNEPPFALTGGTAIRVQGGIIGAEDIDAVFDGSFSNAQDLGGTPQPAIFIYDRGATAPPLHIVEAAGSGGSSLAGNMEISLETSSDMVNWSTPVDISEIMQGYSVGPGYKATDFTLLRYARFQIYKITGDATALGEINLLPAPNTALFNSYFPFSTGDITTPTATGTNTTVSTLHQGASASQLATLSDANIETLLMAGLNNPATSLAPSFTPNDSHWLNPDPATSREAVNRLAAMLYNWLWEPIY